MKKKRKLSPEQIADNKRRAEEAAHRRAIKSLTTRVKKDCKTSGLPSVTFKLRYLEEYKTATLLPNVKLSREETILAFKEGIKLYKESLL